MAVDNYLNISKMDIIIHNVSHAFNIGTDKPVDSSLMFGSQRDTLYIVIPVTIIYSLIFLAGTSGNILTCIVITRNKSMHTATNYYLFSLAISDLLLLISGMPQEMFSIWYKWPYVFGNTFCVLRGLAAETSTNASVLTITLFTIERYLAICHPFVSHKMSKLSRASKHVLFSWIVAFGLALPQALQFGIRDFNGVAMCLQTRVIIEHSFEISTFLFFFAPMILITVLYSLIGLRLRKTDITKDGNLQQSLSKDAIHRKPSQSTRRVVKMLVAVVCAFFICWAPFHAQRLVAIYGTADDHMPKSSTVLIVYHALTYASGVFYYMSTCINPIFYNIMSNKFRDAFTNTMSQIFCKVTEDNKANNRSRHYSYTAVAVTRNPMNSSRIARQESGNNNIEPATQENLENKIMESVNDSLSYSVFITTPEIKIDLCNDIDEQEKNELGIQSQEFKSKHKSLFNIQVDKSKVNSGSDIYLTKTI